MRKSLAVKLCLAVFLAPVVVACDSPHYVDNNGTRYYNANSVSTDTLPSGPYTKNGQYINNPETTTNTRDNRGNRLPGYDHDVNQDYREATPGRTVIYQDTYPTGTEVYSDGKVIYPDGTVVYPKGATTTTTRTTIIENQ